MKHHYILIACEESQTICKALRQAGFEAFSNDLQTCSGGHPEWHILGDALEVIKGNGCFDLQDGNTTPFIDRWTMVIAHPPCTYLARSSAVAKSLGKQTLEQMHQGAHFFSKMLEANADYIAVENPIPLKAAGLPPYTQLIQPYNFGHQFSKATCLWLKNLPPLLPTHARCRNPKPFLLHCAGNSKRRSKTFPGIADAMVQQWGTLIQ